MDLEFDISPRLYTADRLRVYPKILTRTPESKQTAIISQAQSFFWCMCFARTPEKNITTAFLILCDFAPTLGSRYFYIIII